MEFPPQLCGMKKVYRLWRDKRYNSLESRPLGAPGVLFRMAVFSIINSNSKKCKTSKICKSDSAYINEKVTRGQVRILNLNKFILLKFQIVINCKLLSNHNYKARFVIEFFFWSRDIFIDHVGDFPSGIGSIFNRHCLGCDRFGDMCRNFMQHFYLIGNLGLGIRYWRHGEKHAKRMYQCIEQSAQREEIEIQV